MVSAFLFASRRRDLAGEWLVDGTDTIGCITCMGPIGFRGIKGEPGVEMAGKKEERNEACGGIAENEVYMGVVN